MIWIALYVGTIFAANWAVTAFGVVPVGLGFEAPAAVYFVGLALTFRDLAQDAVGSRAVLLAILAGAGLSAIVSPALAVASGAAFLVSELADFAVYTPLRRRGWAGAVLISNAVGLVLDSVIFLTLAFGSLTFLPGQIVGKAVATILAVVVLGRLRARR